MPSQSTTTLPPIRRVVTGHDAGNVAKVLMDATVSNTKQAAPGNLSTTLWCTVETPAVMQIGETLDDYGNRELTIPPPADGTRFAIVDFLPGNVVFMHRTETVDYVIVMSGKIEMDMDNSTVKLNAGDVMVQRGTNHAWANRSTEPARVAFVLVDAKPLGVGKPVPGPGKIR